jgi:hypothetical protein
LTGYHGYSKSNRAIHAEANGKMNATKFAEWLRKLGWAGATGAFVKKCVPSCEWHHTSCKYNVTDYYDPFEFFEGRREYRKLFQKWKAERKEEAKKLKPVYFKCWNLYKERDPRRWNWKITTCYGMSCISLEHGLRKVLEVLDKHRETTPPSHKTSLRVYNETTAALHELEAKLREEIQKLKKERQ